MSGVGYYGLRQWQERLASPCTLTIQQKDINVASTRCEIDLLIGKGSVAFSKICFNASIGMITGSTPCTQEVPRLHGEKFDNI